MVPRESSFPLATVLSGTGPRATCRSPVRGCMARKAVSGIEPPSSYTVPRLSEELQVPSLLVMRAAGCSEEDYPGRSQRQETRGKQAPLRPSLGCFALSACAWGCGCGCSGAEGGSETMLMCPARIARRVTVNPQSRSPVTVPNEAAEEVASLSRSSVSTRSLALQAAQMHRGRPTLAVPSVRAGRGGGSTVTLLCGRPVEARKVGCLVQARLGEKLSLRRCSQTRVLCSTPRTGARTSLPSSLSVDDVLGRIAREHWLRWVWRSRPCARSRWPSLPGEGPDECLRLCRCGRRSLYGSEIASGDL
ncbi:hypothetical protein CALCODRAFT_183313 [Calocera cornea HHB12733]|uniref:Uncharacterized protein n=1 Tax=Calocera cornea HHB12733 TaxID=1353952 RepID=A0A165CB39_9BASI|nr:hypothetical protein CALCODRAFT_183313 [Calocera cornea HHB12733]